MNHISDEPVDLNEIDMLESKKYSEILKENIINSPVDKSITIGIFGEWGSGKSSIIKTTQIDLSKTHPKIKFIPYDSWKYTNDGFRRTFLLQIQKELDSKRISKKDLQNRFYANISSSKYIWLILIAPFLITFVALQFFFDLFASLFMSLFVFILGILVQLLPVITSSEVIQKPHYFSPEQFENDFKTMIEDALKKKTIEKIVIIIDNIDRCSPEQAYETLTDVKGFLGNKGVPIIFLIPVDDQALTNQIQKYGDKPAEFIRKIFDRSIYIKQFKGHDLYDFVNEIAKKENLNLKADTLYILAEDYATNPRRITRLLNNLQDELMFFDKCYGMTENDETFSKKYETAICKFLIIREEWPYFYSIISQKPEELKRKTGPLNDFTYPEDEFEVEIEKRKEEREKQLIKFLGATTAITKNLDEEIIQKLTSSRDLTVTIPYNILEQLKERKYDTEFESFIEDDNQFSVLCTFLINELKKGVQRSAFETKVPETIDHLLKINEYRSIEKWNTQIENCIGNSSIFSFITSLTELENLVKYTSELKEIHKKDYLYNSITNELNLVYENVHSIEGSFYADLFLAFINHYPNDSICLKLQTVFVKRFNVILGFSYLLESGELIRMDRIQKLISDDLIDLLIRNVGTEEDEYVLLNLVYISSIYKIKDGQITNLNNKLSSVCADLVSNLKNNKEKCKKIVSYYKAYSDTINKNLTGNKKIILDSHLNWI